MSSVRAGPRAPLSRAGAGRSSPDIPSPSSSSSALNNLNHSKQVTPPSSTKHLSPSSSMTNSPRRALATPAPNSSPSASGNGSPSPNRHLKRFTHEQIRAKVAERRDIPQYLDLLMAAAVQTDDAGVTFDTSHSSWKQLVRLVRPTPSASPQSIASSNSSPPSHMRNADESSSSSDTDSGTNAVRPRLTVQIKRGNSNGSPNNNRLTPKRFNTLSQKPGSRLKDRVRNDSFGTIRPGKSSAMSISELATLNSSGNSTSTAGSTADNRLSSNDEQLLAQLQREMQSLKPDVLAIRHAAKICGIPEHLRGGIWKALLGVGIGAGAPLKGTAAGGSTTTTTGSESDDPPSPRINSTALELDLHNQRVIHADIDRTLPHLATFRSASVRETMEQLLTRYCKSHHVSYKQGMNYIMAPFFVVDLVDPEDIYTCYCLFIRKFLTNTFTDNDFGGLQCIFSLFRMLLLYHDPELCIFLDKNDMSPELYASSWFITLYANRLGMDVLVFLWDQLLLEEDEDPLLHYFVSLALLISNREQIFKIDHVNLPQLLASIKINTRAEVSTLVQKAKLIYRSQTMPSARTQLRSITNHNIHVDSKEFLAMSNMPCLALTAKELVEFCYLNDKPAAIKYFVLDCRSSDQYAAGHLPCGVHLDPDLLLRPQELQDKVESLTSMKGCHFCFLGEGADRVRKIGGATEKDSCAMLRHYFLQKGFKYVSQCDGGYKACHAMIVSNHEYELVDHNPKLCLECNPNSRKLGQGFFSAFRQRISSILTTSSMIPSMLTDGVGKSQAKKNKLSEEYKQFHLPETCVPVDVTNELAMLHTILRDRKSTPQRLSKAVLRLSAIAVSQALSSVEMKEFEVNVPSGGLFTGLAPANALCGVGFDQVDEVILRYALDSFTDFPGLSEPIEFGQITFSMQPYRSNLPSSISPDASPRTKTLDPSPTSSALAEALANAGSDGYAIVSSSSVVGTLPSLPAAASVIASAASSSTSSPVPDPSPSATTNGTPVPLNANGSGASTVATDLLVPLSQKLPSLFPSAPPQESPESKAVKKGLSVSVHLPDDVDQRSVILYRTVLNADFEYEIVEAIQELMRRGVKHITVACVVIGRSTMWRIAERHENVLVIATAVDETNKSRLVPGVGNLAERMQVAVLQQVTSYVLGAPTSNNTPQPTHSAAGSVGSDSLSKALLDSPVSEQKPPLVLKFLQATPKPKRKGFRTLG